MNRDLQQESHLMTLRVNDVIQSTLLSCSTRLKLIINMTNLIQIAKMQNTATDEHEKEVINNAFDKRKWNIEKLIKGIWESIRSTNKQWYIDYCRSIHRSGHQIQNTPLPEMRRSSVIDREHVHLQTM